ncbi:MAG: hypothetical protein ACO20F_08265 [Robiginitalea sp.]|jgi:hypothetical protein
MRLPSRSYILEPEKTSLMGIPGVAGKRKPKSNGMMSFRTAHDEEPSGVF